MSVLSLAEAKEHLNKSETKVDDDDELQAIINAAETAIGNRVGPLSPQTFTQRLTGCTRAFVLNERPLISVTSLTPLGGVAMDTASLHVDHDAGSLSLPWGGWFGSRWYDVTYVAGYTQTPEDLLFAVKVLVKHLWSTQRGPKSVRGTSADQATAPGYLLPNMVEALLEPYTEVVL